jgi:hypothetical protein
MINQNGTLKLIPNVIFSVRRDGRALIAPVESRRTLRDVWFAIPMVYIKTTLWTLTVITAITAGIMMPDLAKSLSFLMLLAR